MAGTGTGTPDDPWVLQTPPLSSDYTMHRDTRDGVDVIVCTVGKTVLLYDARCLDDLHADAPPRTATGSISARPTSRSRRRTARSRRGAARPTTRSAAGTG